MAYPRPPQLNPNQVQALLAGWYDLVGPQVGNWGRGGYGPYRGQLAAGVNPWLMMGADSQGSVEEGGFEFSGGACCALTGTLHRSRPSAMAA